MKLVKCDINWDNQYEYSITTNIKYYNWMQKKAIVLMPYASYAISVIYEYHPISNLISPLVAKALHITTKTNVIIWGINSNVETGVRLNFDSYILSNGSFAIKLPPRGDIYYSSPHPENRAELERKLTFNE